MGPFFRLPETGRRRRIVGRRREVAELLDVWRARKHDSSCCFGEQGIGKTMIARQFGRLLVSRRAEVIDAIREATSSMTPAARERIATRPEGGLSIRDPYGERGTTTNERALAQVDAGRRA